MEMKQHKNTVYSSTHNTKKPTQLPKHPHITNPPPPPHTHTLKEKLKQPQNKTHAN